MRRVLVTGGSGFIGRRVCDQGALRGWNMVPFDRANGHDIRDIESLAQFDVDHVIHLAGVLGTDELFDAPFEAVEVNVAGTLNVLEYCRAWGAGFTGITMPDVFPSLYTATKMGAARIATAYHHTHGVPVSHVRAFNAFGPGQAHGANHPRKIIPAFATEAWTDQPMIVWGDGEQGVDLVYVDDVARMLLDATLHGDDATFDAGTGQSFTVNEVAAMVADIVGKGTPERRPMRRGERPTKIVAHGDGWDRLDWRPRFQFLDLEDTVKWYRPS